VRTFPLVPFAAALALTVATGGALPAQPSANRTLQSASDVFEAIQSIPLRCIPPKLLAEAQGVAIIPGVVKAGLIIGGRLGHGVVFSRNQDGSWGGPAFVTIGGASLGLQAGVQSTDVVLVFKTHKSLEQVLRGKGKVTLGADAAVAAGPVGREASAGTDGRLMAEVYSYSRSRGLFAGVSFDGAVISYDPDANQAFQSANPGTIALADKLRAQVAVASGVPVPLPPPGPSGTILMPVPLPSGSGG
jgi:lipid-binding SYLF domain-containing protein